MTDHFVHEQAICESKSVGSGTTIWAFAHVLPGAKIGIDCNINDGVFIENDVIIGDRVTLKCGVQLWDGLRVEDDVFIGPNATFTNDMFPRSKQRPEQFLSTTICVGASVGANATILPGVTVGQYAMIGAAAVVTRDVPPYAKVVGNPARIVGYVESSTIEADSPQMAVGTVESTTAGHADGLSSSNLVRIPHHIDLRGSLVAAEIGRDLPFEPRRYFVVFDVPSQYVRGEHAHRECWQYLSCLTGSLEVHLDDGTNRYSTLLDSPEKGLVIPPYVWASQFNYTPDATLLVLASHNYDDGDYIRDYDEFLVEVRERA